MNDRNGLNEKMAEIGGRFLKRTLGELDHLRELLTHARAGNADSVKEIERAAHKIAGSGGMFGFDAISERAQEIEILAESGASDAQSLQNLDDRLALLEGEVHSAARARGIE